MTGAHDKDPWVDDLLRDVAQMPVQDAPDDLMARVLADAHDVMPAPGGGTDAEPIWRQIVTGLGGWLSVGGLVAATATGFVIGLGALEGTGLGALWLVDFGAFDVGAADFGVYGWDFEEG